LLLPRRRVKIGSLLKKVRQENILKTVAEQKKIQEREDWHKLVVKVIVWKEGTVGKGVVQLVNKITPKEWKLYRKKLTSANAANAKDKTHIRLKETWDRIKEHGGFS